MKPDITIIGGGFAGLATAYFLSRRSPGKILLLEMEDQPGSHASGQNAAMIRQQVADPQIALLAKEGTRWLREERHVLPGTITYRQTGSVMIGSDQPGGGLYNIRQTCNNTGIMIENYPAGALRKKFPALERANFQTGSFCSSDGVIDIHALLYGFLQGFRQAGGTVWTRARVSSIRVEHDRIVALETSRGKVEPGIVVNAAGAWAAEIGKLAGAENISLTPYRRHLFFTEPVSFIRSDDPFIWDVEHSIYFRPETGGLLVSACDQERFAAGPAPSDSRAIPFLLDKLRRFLPRLSGLRMIRNWAGLRTMTHDGRFILRWDHNVKNLFWVAGLGGHGVTCSPAYGQHAAQMILS